MANPAQILAALRKSFTDGALFEVESRKAVLRSLLKFLTEKESMIFEAVHSDLRRGKTEAMYVLSSVKSELCTMVKNMDKWLQDEYVSRVFLTSMDSVYIQRQALGVSLILGAWNFPFYLTLYPLIGAIAAGNTVMVKPSELAPASAKLMFEELPKYIDPSLIGVVNGDAAFSAALVADNKFDHILFTGSSRVGRLIYKAAADKLTPVTLELGGKCPTYVDKDADLDLAANRIAFAKGDNAGQVCVSPDYVLCHADVVTEFTTAICNSFKKFYGENPQKSPDLARIINAMHFKRITKMLAASKGTIKCGGESDESDLYISPTVVKIDRDDDELMSEEIFGPVLPIITVESIDDAITFINSKDKALQISVYTKSDTAFDRIKKETSSGSLLRNTTLVNCAISELPFGGVGLSGFGRYHGRWSIDTFSHLRSIQDRSTNRIVDGIMFPPYNESHYNKMAWLLSSSEKSKCQIL